MSSLTVSHCLSPSLTVSHCLSPSLTVSHRLSLSYSQPHLTLHAHQPHLADVTHTSGLTSGDFGQGTQGAMVADVDGDGDLGR